MFIWSCGCSEFNIHVYMLKLHVVDLIIVFIMFRLLALDLNQTRPGFILWDARRLMNDSGKCDAVNRSIKHGLNGQT